MVQARQYRDNKEDLNVCSAKILFMGNSSVGKNCIIQAFLNGTSQRGNPHERNIFYNHGGWTKNIDVNVDDRRHRIELNIWKIGGDNNHNLPHLVTRDVQVCVFVFAIDNRNSFD